MPRKKVTTNVTIDNWDEVNETLREIAEKQSSMDEKIAAYNEEEAKQRKELDKFCNPIRSRVSELEDAIKLFCEDNRNEFKGKKSRELPNGIVSFRLGTPKVKTLKGFTWKAVIEILKRTRRGRTFIKTEPKIDKEMIIREYKERTVRNATLLRFGIQVAQDETFGYEVNLASE